MVPEESPIIERFPHGGQIPSLDSPGEDDDVCGSQSLVVEVGKPVLIHTGVVISAPHATQACASYVNIVQVDHIYLICERPPELPYHLSKVGIGVVGICQHHDLLAFGISSRFRLDRPVREVTEGQRPE